MKQLTTIAPAPCCVPGAPPLPAHQRETLAAKFKALGDPARVAIVNRLATEGEACVCHFADLALSQPTISHHLRVLREAGLVEVARKRRTWSFYRLVPNAISDLAFALGGAPEPELVLATARGNVAG